MGDGRQYFELQGAPNGAIFDQQTYLTAPAQSDENLMLVQSIIDRDFWTDLGWNMKDLKTPSSHSDKGWIVDCALPAPAVLRRRGLQAFDPMTMRANFLRYDWAPDYTTAWSIIDKDGRKRRLNAHNWAPVKYGNPHVSPQAMGFLKLVP